MSETASPVTVTAIEAADQPARTPALDALYRGFQAELLIPLWTEIGELMPLQPHPTALPHRWRWQNLLPLAERRRQARVALPACVYKRH